MGIIDITKATVREDGPGYNKFDITKDNLKARILIPTNNIEQCFTHSIYRSEAVMKDQGGYTKPEWENSSYAGTFICTGDFEKVAKSKSYGDPEGCPACKAMASGPKVVSAPKKTFALNVLQYQTKPGTTQVAGTQVEAKLWKHGDDKKISPIITAIQETERSLNQIDFLIECPPDGVQFKKWQINFSEQVAYTKDDTLKENVKAAIANDLYSNDDLTAACGEKVTKEQLDNEIKQAVAAATAGQQAPNEAMFVASEPALVGGASEEVPSIEAGSIDDLL